MAVDDGYSPEYHARVAQERRETVELIAEKLPLLAELLTTVAELEHRIEALEAAAREHSWAIDKPEAEQ